MTDFTEKLLLPDIPQLHMLDVYEQNGGYQALRKAIGMKQDEVIEEVKKSNLKGRGGAGFPTGLKWSFMPKQSAKPKYICANGDEGEPGTFKDRQIFEYNPHLFIEGSLIAAYAMGVQTIYVYIRGEYVKWIKLLQKAIDDAYAKNYIGNAILGYLHRPRCRRLYLRRRIILDEFNRGRQGIPPRKTTLSCTSWALGMSDDDKQYRNAGKCTTHHYEGR